jgi:hypothetical protein
LIYRATGGLIGSWKIPSLSEVEGLGLGGIRGRDATAWGWGCAFETYLNPIADAFLFSHTGTQMHSCSEILDFPAHHNQGNEKASS